ncbi:MAG: mechanosensitive ion channel family protein [Spirochaetota bacterium]
MDIQKFIDHLVAELGALLTVRNIGQLLTTLLVIGLVLVAFQIVHFATRRLFKGRVTDQTLMLTKKGLRYTSLIVVVLIFFDRLGLNLSALFGAAGIAGIAIGFAAQTSVSNIISGLFLVSEKPFSLGDVITVGDITGTIQSIDLLSIKIQTFDNRYVRIPNETIIKSNVINVTRYPIRRMDINIAVSYSDDLESVMGALAETARNNILVLDNPETLVLVDRFDEKGVVILLGLWYLQSDFLELKNSIMKDIRRVFESKGYGLPAARVILDEERLASQTRKKP